MTWRDRTDRFSTLEEAKEACASDPENRFPFWVIMKHEDGYRYLFAHELRYLSLNEDGDVVTHSERGGDWSESEFVDPFRNDPDIILDAGVRKILNAVDSPAERRKQRRRNLAAALKQSDEKKSDQE